MINNLQPPPAQVVVLSVLVAGLAARPQQRRVRLPSSYLAPAPAPARDQEPAPSITRTLAR